MISNTPNSQKSPNSSSGSRPSYEYLVVYMLGKVIQDLTVQFCERFVDKFSRTRDQMVQAARSNPQNIAEGSTQESLKSYIQLAGVAKGSNEELTKDYQDFLRQHNLPTWDKDHLKVREFRGFRVVWVLNSPNTLNTPTLSKDPTEAGNMLLTFCNLEGFLLRKHVDSLIEKHAKEGGLSERLYAARKTRRGY